MWPWNCCGAFSFACNDELAGSIFRWEADERARGVFPHWPVGWFTPEQTSSLDLPQGDVMQLFGLVQERRRSHGLAAAIELSVGLFEIRDDGVRAVRVGGRDVVLRSHGGRLHVFAGDLLDLAGFVLDPAGVERFVQSLGGSLPEDAFHRANSDMGRDRPAAGSWWVASDHVAAFAKAACPPEQTPALVEFSERLEDAVAPGWRRDLALSLP